MTHPWGLVALLVSVLLTLVPLSYSRLTDQLWLGGFFDAADEDYAAYAVELRAPPSS